MVSVSVHLSRPAPWNAVLSRLKDLALEKFGFVPVDYQIEHSGTETSRTVTLSLNR